MKKCRLFLSVTLKADFLALRYQRSLFLAQFPQNRWYLVFCLHSSLQTETVLLVFKPLATPTFGEHQKKKKKSLTLWVLLRTATLTLAHSSFDWLRKSRVATTGTYWCKQKGKEKRNKTGTQCGGAYLSCPIRVPQPTVDDIRCEGRARTILRPSDDLFNSFFFFLTHVVFLFS